MRSNRLFSLAVVACMAAAAACTSAVSHAGHAIAATARYAWDRITSWLEPAAERPKSPAQTRPRVALVAARSFVARLMRRERPIVTPLWRMCPSV